MNEIIPSLLVDSREEFEKRLRIVEPYVKTIHVDVLDGTMFPFTSWFDARAVGAMVTDVHYELHLMCQNPLPIVASWKEHVPTFTRAIVHAEINRPVGSVIDNLHHIHMIEAGVALNPETPLSQLNSQAHSADMILVMGVHPGKSGQKFLGLPVLEKIRKARQRWPSLPIEIDGGVTDDNIPLLIAAGATRVCAASAIFKSESPTIAVDELVLKFST